MDVIQSFINKTNKSLEAFKDEIKKVRANRPTSSLIEDIKVDYYGNKTPINHLSSITVHPPREIHVQVWDSEAMKPVLSAIQGSDLGLSVNADENTIRLFMPELSQERRDELIKHIKKVSEEFRIQVRNIRDEVKKEIEGMSEKSDLTEDDEFKLKEELQKETEKVNNEIERIFNEKKKEIEL
ncbi:MAG: ribosome recycling factor [Candidatus Paceibacterota bacterium]